jgi:hypothetical protein
MSHQARLGAVDERRVDDRRPIVVVAVSLINRRGPTTRLKGEFLSKRAGTRPALSWQTRAEARSATASNAPLGFARGGDIGKSRTLLLLLLRRHDEYPPGLDRLTKYSNLCSRTPARIAISI